MSIKLNYFSIIKRISFIRSFMKKNTEVQSHGFIWERELCMNIYRATAEELTEIKYTSKIDLPSKFNRLDNCGISMKTSCSPNSVCMADCLRVYDAVSCGNPPNHLTVIHYTQNDETNTKHVTTITEIDITNSTVALFGDLTRDELEGLDKLVKSVPQKRKPTVEEYTKMYALRDALQRRCAAIHLDIKCNSTQSRLQCSFNSFQQFLQDNPDRVIERSKTTAFRGGSISSQILSSRRTFKKSPPPQPPPPQLSHVLSCSE